MDKEEVFNKAAAALTDAQTLATINADSETMLSVAGWWVELFDRLVAIDIMDSEGAKSPIGFHYNIGGEHESDED